MWTIRTGKRTNREAFMPPLTIDLQGVTVDLLRPTDNPLLADALRKATASAPQRGDGAGFDNRV